MRGTPSDPGYSLQAGGKEGGELLLSISGRISLIDTERLLGEMETLLEECRPAAVTIDLGRVSYMDSAGTLALLRLERKASKLGVPFALAQVPDEIRGIMGLIEREGIERPPLHTDTKPDGWVEAVGAISLGFLRILRP